VSESPAVSPAFWRDLGRLPNLVSLCRIAVIVVAAVIFLSGWRLTGLALGIPAGLSDYLDGWLARRRGEVTELGSLLDVLADLLYQLVCFSLGVHEGVWPTYLLVAWGFRDLTVTVLRASAAQQGFAIPSSHLAKVAINFNYYSFILMGLDVARPFSSSAVTLGIHWLGLAGVHAGIAMQWIAGGVYLARYARRYRGTPA
jgi:cardiolipin synthase